MKSMKKIILISVVLFISSYICGQGMLVNDQVPIVNSNALPSPGATTNVRFITVYLPEAFDESNPDLRFPTVYYLPGLGGTNESFTIGNAAILDRLIDANEAVPMIVVHVDPSLVNGIDTDGKRRYQGTWYLNSELNGDFEDFMVKDLIPYVDANYLTIAQPAFRAVMGQSMGGFGSLFHGITHPELYAGFGHASGTPFWTIVTAPQETVPQDIPEPGNQMFSLNSLVIPEIPTSGPNAGRVTPDNGDLTFSVFSWAGAKSPNVNNPPFFVDLPFEVDADSRPIFTNGTFQIANTVTGERTTITQSLTPRPEIIDRWKETDPFFLVENTVDTTKRQAIYQDGGSNELINAVGSRVLSDKISGLGIDNEYILFNGGHITCLIEAICSRHQTMFQKFSAKFSDAGAFADDVRNKIVGIGTIILAGNAQLLLNNDAQLGIETLPEADITTTDITMVINDQARIKIGNDSPQEGETARGDLQVGNRFTKARIDGDPDLANHEVRWSLIIDGDDAALEIAQGGFFGFGVGIDGQNPAIPNQWGVTTLTNVKNLSIDIRNGQFIHNNVFTGEDEDASLFALGQSDSYTLKINQETGLIRGGGNFICLADSILQHPVVESATGTFPAGGVRRNLNRDPNAVDFFYQLPMGSTRFYTNPRQVGFLASSSLLDAKRDIENIPTPFEITTADLATFCDFIAMDENDSYSELSSKEGALTDFNGEIFLTFIDDNDIIVRLPESQIPIGEGQTIDLEQLQQDKGAALIDARFIDGQLTVIRVADPSPTDFIATNF